MSNACPACGKKYSLPSGSVGRAFVCKRCGLKLQITDRGLAIPSVPDTGPPIPPPRPIDHGPPPPPVPVAAPAAPVAYPAYPPAPPPPPAPAREEFDVVPADDEDEPPRPRRGPPPPGNAILDYVLLRRHIAPVLIVVFFWAGTLLLVLSGLTTIAGSLNAPKGYSVSGLDLGGLGLGDPAVVPPGGDRPRLPAGAERGFSLTLFVSGLVQLFVGPVVLRVWCEVLIVVFRIHEALLDVKDRLGPGRS